LALRVFLVDDLVNMHRLIEDLLDIVGGFQLVGTAMSEGEAKLWLEDHPLAWDVAVVDLVLDGGSGMAVISRCKELNPASKVCVFSSYVTPVLSEHCARLGADVVFHKDESLSFVVWLHDQSAPGTTPRKV